MESDPFALVESIAIAAFATGAEKAFIYVRAEYPLAHERIRNAIARQRAATSTGSRSSCASAPAPTCAARRRRSSSRSRATAASRATSRRSRSRSGLFGKPTAVNNVETLFNVLEVLRDGGAEYARTGTEGSTGTRLFCVSGCVERPGLYELPFGATLRELLDLAGSAPPKAVLLGGAAGAFVGPELLDLKLTHEDTRAAGVTLGSGVVIVYDERGRARAGAAADRGVLPRRVVRPVRAVPRRHRAAGGGAEAPRRRRAARGRARDARRARAGDARRLDLRPRPDRRERDRVGDRRTSESSPDDDEHPDRRTEEDARADRRRRRACASSRARRSSTPAACSGSTRRRSATATR